MRNKNRIETKFVRHRKIGAYEIYIYKDYMSEMFVLQEEETGKRSHYITSDYDLEPVLLAYNWLVKEALFYK